MEYLRMWAFELLEAARDDIEMGKFDLATFHAEQALQLALNLARDYGHYSHTHDLRDLFELKERRPEVWDFYGQ